MLLGSLSESLDIRITIEQNKLVWYQNKISKTEQNNSSLGCKGLKRAKFISNTRVRTCLLKKKTLKQKDKVLIIDLCSRSEANL